MGNLKKNERGAVLIYFALLLVPLILFVALAVDTTRLASSHSQQRDVAGFAALTALETYVASTGADHAAKYTDAKQKAELTIKHQLNTLLAKKIDADVATGELIDGTNTLGPPSNPNEVIGTIWGGNWWFAEPTDSNGTSSCADWVSQAENTPPMDPQCPCPGNVWDGPCFEKNDSTATTVGAFRISLRTSESSPVKTVFARVGGFGDVKVSSTSQAAKVPRRGVFLVDLSRSMSFETHTPYPPATLRPTEYAFRVKEGIGGSAPCNGVNDYTNNCITPTRLAGQPAADFCKMTSILSNFMWNRASVLGGENLGLVRSDLNLFGPTKHYKDDYQCIMVDTDDDGTEDQSYLVDTDALLPGAVSAAGRPHLLDPGAPNYYNGPQPLTTVLSSIRAALKTIEERSIAGDEIGVIFFDEDILEIRTFPKPDPITNKTGLTAVGQTEFETLLEITNVDTSDPDFQADLATRLKSLIFPRTLDDAGFSGRAANTSFPEALVRALDMLTESDISGAADNFIAVFSDGLTNCSHDSPGGSGASGEFQPDPYSDHSTFLSYDTATGVSSLPNGADFRCENVFTNPVNQFNNHLVSLQESSAIIAGIPDSGPDYSLPPGFRSYKDRGISVHYFLVGEKVQPNTFVAANEAGDACMQAEEAATGGYPFAYGGPAPPNTDPSTSGIFSPGNPAYDYAQDTYVDANNPYFHPNAEFYGKFVLPTSGIWAPIRPACDPSNWPAALPLPRPCDKGGLLDRINQHCASEVASYSGTLNNPEIPIADIPGIIVNRALICDPYCREPAASSADNVAEIYNRNPYVLVESNQ